MLFPLFDLNPHRRFPVVTLLIIAANFAVLLWSWSLPAPDQGRVTMQYGFVPARLSHLDSGKEIPAPIVGINKRNGRPIRMQDAHLSTKTADVYFTFLSTMFLHAGWGHLLMNMWTLWVFGKSVEDRLGHFVYLAFYLLGGIVATLVFWASDPKSLVPVIGASGAVAAVLGGYAVTFPTAKIRTLVFFLLFAIIDIPALVLLGIWFGLELASGLLGLRGVALGPVAFWSHIGGFVAGMILMPLLALGASPPGKDWHKESEELFRFEDPRFKQEL